MCQQLVDSYNSTLTQHTIHYTYTGENPVIMADLAMMKQIVGNLLTNAVKYSPDADKVDLRVNCRPARIEIQVQDYGIGMRETDIRQAFTPFYRAEAVQSIQGSGLGLSIVQYALDKHSGLIHIDSKIGEGALFTVHLPRS
jgi:signal transduction histidine kinase